MDDAPPVQPRARSVAGTYRTEQRPRSYSRRADRSVSRTRSCSPYWRRRHSPSPAVCVSGTQDATEPASGASGSGPAMSACVGERSTEKGKGQTWQSVRQGQRSPIGIDALGPQVQCRSHQPRRHARPLWGFVHRGPLQHARRNHPRMRNGRQYTQRNVAHHGRMELRKASLAFASSQAGLLPRKTELCVGAVLDC